MSLILSRKKGESIIAKMGEVPIVIRIHDICGTNVKVAIEAPLEVTVHRLEIWEKIEQGEGA